MTVFDLAAKDRAIGRVSDLLGLAAMKLLNGDPREAARRAHKARPWGPSITELEARIRKFQEDHSSTTEEAKSPELQLRARTSTTRRSNV